MKLVVTVFTLFSLLYIAGCTTLADAIAAKGTGEYKIYGKSKDEMWPIVVESVPAVGLELVTENESSGMVLAQRGVSAFSYGENVAIFVEPHEEDQCRVEVVSKKAMETNVLAPNWSNAIFGYLDEHKQ